MLEFVERIIEILLVFAAIRTALGIVTRIFRGMGGAHSDGAHPRGPAAPAQKTVTDPDSPSEATLLHQDPVCGTYVATASSFRKICRGEVVHFCSEECRDKYAG
jgi:YHS domain-containing protein